MFNDRKQFTMMLSGALLCGSLALAQEAGKASAEQKAVPKPDAASGVLVFVDPLTHQIRPAERGEVNALTSSKPASKPSANVKTAATPKIATTSRVVTGPSGAKGVVLGQDMMQFMLVTKDANGALKEDCVSGVDHASQALKTTPAAKPPLTQTPGELDVQ